MIDLAINTVPLLVGLVNPINAAWDCRIIYRELTKEIDHVQSLSLNIPEQYLFWHPYYSACYIMGYQYTLNTGN